MSSLNMSLTLNDRLAQASKKFTKACEQIKLLKQQISEYIGMFTYNDGLGPFDSNDSLASVTQQQSAMNGYLIQSNRSILSNHILNNTDDFNHNLARENIRHKIEALQNFKSIFFMYAHQKAEEITKLQCELYGEEAVREAYDMAPPDVLMPAMTTTTNNNESNNETLLEFNQTDSDITNLTLDDTPFEFSGINNTLDESLETSAITLESDQQTAEQAQTSSPQHQEDTSINWTYTQNYWSDSQQITANTTDNGNQSAQLHLVEYSF